MKVWIKIIFRIEEFTLVWLTEWCQYLTIAFGRCRKEAKWTVSQCNRGHRTAVLVHNIAPYLVCTQVGATWWVGGCRSMSKSLSWERRSKGWCPINNREIDKIDKFQRGTWVQAKAFKRGNEDKVRSLMKVRMRIILLLTLFAAYNSLAVSIGITLLVYGEVPTADAYCSCWCLYIFM